MIREHIISNFKNDSESEIYDAINSSVEDKDEVVLPGLGVFLSLIWKNSDNDLKKKLSTIIKESLN